MKKAFWIFLGLYAVAVLLLLVGTFGWFGEDKDPLAAVFLLPLGLPWNFLADRAGIAGLLDLTLAPLINAAILFWFWKRRKTKPNPASGWNGAKSTHRGERS